MKASIRRKYCSPNQIAIEIIEPPIPKGNQVLVKVHATTVNRTDCANLTAKPFIMRFVLGFIKPQKVILGTDFAGEVITLGKDVNSFNVGDKVFGFNDIGSESQAEYITLTEDDLFLIPKETAFKEAAASLEGAHYAYNFLLKLKPKKGDKILVNGATGAIGSAAVQLLKHFGCYVTAVGDTKNKDLFKQSNLEEVGLNVLRFTDEEVHSELDKVVLSIERYIKSFESTL